MLRHWLIVLVIAWAIWLPIKMAAMVFGFNGYLLDVLYFVIVLLVSRFTDFSSDRHSGWRREAASPQLNREPSKPKSGKPWHQK